MLMSTSLAVTNYQFQTVLLYASLLHECLKETTSQQWTLSFRLLNKVNWQIELPECQDCSMIQVLLIK